MIEWPILENCNRKIIDSAIKLYKYTHRQTSWLIIPIEKRIKIVHSLMDALKMNNDERILIFIVAFAAG